MVVAHEWESEKHHFYSGLSVPFFVKGARIETLKICW